MPGATSVPEFGGKAPAQDNRIQLVHMGWYHADFEIYINDYRHIVRYKNNWSHETVELDGRQVVRGGDWTSYRSIFQFSISNPHGEFLCVLEPRIEGLLDLHLARLTRLVVTVDGKVLGEIDRRKRT